MSGLKISFLGAGKVAEALCLAFFREGHIIRRIISPGKINGTALADSCNAAWSSSPVFEEDTDIILAAVPDHLLINLLQTIKCSPGTLVAHTAGSYGLEIFPESIRSRGLFYPLQTFTKGRKVSFSELPVFVEASDPKAEALLRDLAGSVHSKVLITSTENRRILHIAAVFVSNFTNYMITAGNEIARKAGFDSDILAPLINETISRALQAGPENTQTGPAVRNDLNTIEKHLELLSFSPELRKIYIELTNSIINYYRDRTANEQFQGKTDKY